MRAQTHATLVYIINSLIYIHGMSRSYICAHAVPEPSVTITGYPIESHFYSGLHLTLTCEIEFVPAVDSELQVNVIWTRRGSAINSNRIRAFAAERIRSSPIVYHSNLSFSPLSLSSDDEGEYVCNVSVSTPHNSFLLPPSPVLRRRSVQIESE